jgi:hypothetical protein
LNFSLGSRRVEHGRRHIDGNEATQVGFFLVALGKQPVGAGIYFPIQVTGAFTLVVKAVLGKLYRKPVVRRLVESGNKPFY